MYIVQSDFCADVDKHFIYSYIFKHFHGELQVRVWLVLRERVVDLSHSYYAHFFDLVRAANKSFGTDSAQMLGSKVFDSA